MLNVDKPDIYLLTVNYYASTLIKRLITSLTSEKTINYHLVIVNNSPDDYQIQNLLGNKIYLIEAKDNLGFGKACNLGLTWIYQQNSTALVWLINPDAYLLTDSLAKAQQFFQNHPQISIAGTEVYEPDGKLWFGWGKFIKKTGTIVVVEEPLYYNQKPYLSVEWVTGCSLLINLQQFSQCPQFDSDYFLYYEDFDLCQRYAKQGHLVIVTHQISIIHEPSSITSKYGFLKLTHNIYSYLLSLEKHTHPLVLYARFIRMIFMALIVLPVKPKFALAKLKGILMYSKRIFQSLKIYSTKNHAENLS